MFRTYTVRSRVVQAFPGGSYRGISKPTTAWVLRAVETIRPMQQIDFHLRGEYITLDNLLIANQQNFLYKAADNRKGQFAGLLRADTIGNGICRGDFYPITGFK